MNWVFKTKVKCYKYMMIIMTIFILVSLFVDIYGEFEYQLFLFLASIFLIIIGVYAYFFFSLNDKYYLENDKIIIKNRKQNTVIDIKDIKRIEVCRNYFNTYRGPSIKNYSFIIITNEKKKKPERFKRYNEEYYKIIENNAFLDVIEKYNLKTVDGNHSFDEW